MFFPFFNINLKYVLHIVPRMLQKLLEWGKVEKKAYFEFSLDLENDHHLPSVSAIFVL